MAFRRFSSVSRPKSVPPFTRADPVEAAAGGDGPDGNLGGGVHPAGTAIPGDRPQRRRWRRNFIAQLVRCRAQAGRSARNQPRAIGFFDQLSEAAQRTLLDGAVDTPEAMRGQFNEMLKAWTSGDVEAIGRAFGAEMRDSPNCAMPCWHGATPIGHDGSSSAWPSREGDGRGRCGPPRRRRFGAGHAQKRGYRSHPPPINRARSIFHLANSLTAGTLQASTSGGVSNDYARLR